MGYYFILQKAKTKRGISRHLIQATLKSNLSRPEISVLLIRATVRHVFMLVIPCGATLSAIDTDHVSIALPSYYDLY